MFMSPKWHGTTGICQSMAAHQGEFHQQRLAPRFEAWVQLTDQCLCPLALQNGMRLKEFLANLQTPIPIPMSTNFAVVTSRYLPLPILFWAANFDPKPQHGDDVIGAMTDPDIFQ